MESYYNDYYIPPAPPNHHFNQRPCHSDNSQYRGNQQQTPQYPYRFERYPPSGHTPPFMPRYHNQDHNHQWRKPSHERINHNKVQCKGDKTNNTNVIQTEGAKLYCEPCKKEFSTADGLKNHTKQHKKCEEDGCDFIASAPILKLHFVQEHQEGRFRIVLQTPEDIEKWREQRRRNWPTKENIEAKKQKIAKDREDGILVETKEFVYREPGEGRRGKGRGRGNRGIRQKDRGGRGNRRGNERRFGYQEKRETTLSDLDKNENISLDSAVEEPICTTTKPEISIDQQITTGSYSGTQCSIMDSTEENKSSMEIETNTCIETETRTVNDSINNLSSHADINEIKQNNELSEVRRTKEDNVLKDMDQKNIVENLVKAKTENNTLSSTEECKNNIENVVNDTITGDKIDCSESRKTNVDTNSHISEAPAVEKCISNVVIDVLQVKEDGEIDSEDDISDPVNKLMNPDYNDCPLSRTMDIDFLIDGGVSNGGHTEDGSGNKCHEVVNSADVLGDNGEGDIAECDDKGNTSILPEKKAKHTKKKRPKKFAKEKAPPPEKKVSLLDMLLAGEIRHERNVILQCVRYIVKQNFFDS